MAGFLAEDLLDKFPESRMDASVPGGVLRTHQHIFDHVRLNKGDAASPPCDEGLINLVGFMLPERVPEGGAPSGCGISNHHTAVWDNAAESLSTVMSHGPGQAGSDFLAHVVRYSTSRRLELMVVWCRCGIWDAKQETCAKS